jgi:hypothetical protein
MLTRAGDERGQALTATKEISKLLELGRGHTKETGNCNATSISEKNRRFQAGNWFPD